MWRHQQYYTLVARILKTQNKKEKLIQDPKKEHWKVRGSRSASKMMSLSHCPKADENPICPVSRRGSDFIVKWTVSIEVACSLTHLIGKHQTVSTEMILLWMKMTNTKKLESFVIMRGWEKLQRYHGCGEKVVRKLNIPSANSFRSSKRLDDILRSSFILNFHCNLCHNQSALAAWPVKYRLKCFDTQVLLK